MKKLIVLFLLLLCASAQGANTPPPGTNNSTGFYNANGLWAALQEITINGISSWTIPFFNAANLLYQITNGMNVDPRYYGAACNTQYFNGGFSGAPAQFVTTTLGSAVVSIPGYTPQNCTAAPGNSCDKGKVFSMWANLDVGPTWLANVSTSPLTVSSISGSNITLATALQATNTTGYGGTTGVVMGGYGGQDDTSYIENSIYYNAAYHGGKVVLPPNCLIHNMSVAGGGISPAIWLAGNNGGGLYNNPAAPYAATTPLYISSNNYAEDPLFGINLCGAAEFRISDVSFIGTLFPYISYFPGVALAAIGSSCNMNLAPDAGLLEHVSFANLPVGFGIPLGLNQPVTMNAQIAPGTNQLLVNSVSSTNMVSNYGVGLSLSTTSPDWLVPGQGIHGTNVPANTVVTNVITYLAGSTTGLYALNNTVTAGILAETMTASPPTIFLSGQGRYNQFYNVGIGINGDLSDYRDYSSTFTAAPVYIGPDTGGSTGNSANSFYGERIEDLNDSLPVGAITIDGGPSGSTQGFDQFVGIFCQFNYTGPCILTRNYWSDIQVSGVIQGNGNNFTPNAQIVLGGNGTRFSVTQTLFKKEDYAFPGNSNYLVATLTGASVSQINVSDNIVGDGYAVAPFDFSRAAVSGYKYDNFGDAKVDTTLAFTVTGFNGSALVGGASYFTETATGVATATGNLVISGMNPVPGGGVYYCDGGDITAGAKFAMSATSSTGCTLSTTTTVSPGDKIWGKTGEGN